MSQAWLHVLTWLGWAVLIILIKGRKKIVGLVARKPTFIEEIPTGSLICVEFVGLKLSNWKWLLYMYVCNWRLWWSRSFEGTSALYNRSVSKSFTVVTKYLHLSGWRGFIWSSGSCQDAVCMHHHILLSRKWHHTHSNSCNIWVKHLRTNVFCQIRHLLYCAEMLATATGKKWGGDHKTHVTSSVVTVGDSAAWKNI